jgi:hypothetical protein
MASFAAVGTWLSDWSSFWIWLIFDASLDHHLLAFESVMVPDLEAGQSTARCRGYMNRKSFACRFTVVTFCTVTVLPASSAMTTFVPDCVNAL